jgi:hypothetical protein
LLTETCALLDYMNVKCSSIDIVRIGYVGTSSPPIVFWIGVLPNTLSPNDGLVVALTCQEFLAEHGITDVNVEICETIVTKLANGPELLGPDSQQDSDRTTELRESFSTTLGIPIECTPDYRGTGGFFITEGDAQRLLFVTARHVVFPTGLYKNTHFEWKTGQPRYNVMLFNYGGLPSCPHFWSLTQAQQNGQG